MATAIVQCLQGLQLTSQEFISLVQVEHSHINQVVVWLTYDQVWQLSAIWNTCISKLTFHI